MADAAPVKTSSPQQIPDNKSVVRKTSICVIVALAIILCFVIAFRGVGRWLVREDPLAPADAIVVLSGSMPYRAEETAKVYLMGYAPEVWISRPESAAGELSAMGIRYMGEEDYNREVLIHEGVPESAIHLFPNAIVDTEQEVEEVTREMQQQKKSRVIIVTSPQHTRRVRALWQKIAGRDVILIVRAAYEDPFDADHWWRNTGDALAVTREILGLLNVWAGLPVRPHSQHFSFEQLTERGSFAETNSH
jgi:uncharacterized SAM-binding protein YcdF (DUF218 family)